MADPPPIRRFAVLRGGPIVLIPEGLIAGGRLSCQNDALPATWGPSGHVLGVRSMAQAHKIVQLESVAPDAGRLLRYFC